MSKFTRPILLALAFILIWSYTHPKEELRSTDDVVLSIDEEIAIGNEVILEISNNSVQGISIPSNCPKNPLKVEQYKNGEWLAKEAEVNAEACNSEPILLASNSKLEIGFGGWNTDLFNEKGHYRITFETQIEEQEKVYTKEIDITERSIFKSIWQEGFYKPIFNTLIFLINKIPGNSLGWAIILLTLIAKLILLLPNHKALKAQKLMQKVQPELDGLKKKYKDEPQKLAEETMKIWKKHKVSPMSSCLPMLIQFPILIALFYVVKDGLEFINPQLLYTSLQGFDPSVINTVFLGIIDLAEVNIIALPIIIGGLQFFQMKLTVGKASKSNDTIPMMNKVMMYFMPVMIALFTATLPAAVGFYWGTSTLFGVAQQMFINKSKV